MTPLALKLLPLLAWRDRVTRESLRADALAALIGALVVLPQGVAYATLAGLPPQYGLYCAMVPAAVAALWGSSWHQISGPTNALSLVVFAAIAPLAAPGSGEFVTLVLTLCLLVGLMQLAAGLARLGELVDFISHTVLVGFTAGAALLIIAAQLRHFFGIGVPAGADFFAMLRTAVSRIGTLDPWITATGLVSLALGLGARRWLPRVPYMVVAMVGGTAFAWVLAQAGLAQVPTVGPIPSALPPLSLPSFDPEVWRKLAPAALALTALGLTEAVAIARAIALKSGQRIDGSQEFVGQGLSNLAGAFTSAYPSSGSFNRSGLNFDAGARTPLAAVLSALFLLVILLAVAPLVARLPLATMAALLFVVAWGLIDGAAIRRILRQGRGEIGVLAITFLATIAIQLEFAIFVGVLASLLVYLNRTTHPALTRVLPDAASPQRRFADAGAAPPCPQLDLLRLDGSLYFGAVEHVRDELAAARAARPGLRHVLLVFGGVNFVDFAGGELLVREAAAARAAGGTLWLSNLKPAVRDALERGGYVDEIGRDRVFATKAEALRAIYATLDSTLCRGCTVRVFTECQAALPDGTPRDRPRPSFALSPPAP